VRFDTASPLDFINYVVEKFPFRIKNIRTDRGHEFQSGRDLTTWNKISTAV
jgi:IS30 family transposase